MKLQKPHECDLEMMKVLCSTRLFVLASFILLLTSCFSYSQSRLLAVRFYSSSVHDTMRVRVLLPMQYDHSRAYPLLLLLHGYNGDETDWTTRTNLEHYTATLPLIVIMPEAKNSWYVNSETDPTARYEDYIMSDLPRFIVSRWPIDTTQEAIAGLSMGGYGALVLALRHPNRFLFAGDLSGAITTPSIIDSVLAHPNSPIPGNEGEIYANVVKTFGDSDKKFRDDHDVFTLLLRDTANNLPYIFCAVGIQDGFTDFLPAHRVFTNMLRQYGKLYEYHEVPGIHNWTFWDEEIQQTP